MTTRRDSFAKSSKAGELIRSRFGEVLQTERSARRHPRVEADRLGSCPPADALRAVAAHAEAAEPEAEALATQRGCHPSKVGLAVGSLFSITRNRVADYMLSSEQSYRATLLGMRHGFDLITMLGLAARADSDLELAAWCERWSAARAPLIARVGEELGWFAAHPEEAIRNARLRPKVGR